MAQFQAPVPGGNSLGIPPWQMATSQAMGTMGGRSPAPFVDEGGGRPPVTLPGGGHPVTLPGGGTPFVNQVAQSPYGGFGSAYTIDVLNSLRPLGVQPNQYPGGPAPTPPPRPVPQAPTPSGAFDSLTPAQRLALSGLGGAPRHSGATFAGPGANMAPMPWWRAELLASLGQGGDTTLAHVSPQEAEWLKSLGGAGTVNPATGLRQFYGAEGGSSPDARGGLGGGASTGDSGTSDSGLGGRQGGLGGGWGGVAGDVGMRGPLGFGGLPVHTSAAGYAGMPTGTPQGAGAWGGVGSAYENAQGGYLNRGFFERVADFLSPFGIHNMEPVPGRPTTYSGGTYHTGWNPGEALGGLLGGMAFPGAGIPAGYLGGQAYNALGLPEISLGGTSAVPGFGRVVGPQLARGWGGDPRASMGRVGGGSGG